MAGMTDSGIGAQYTLALLAGQIAAARVEDEPATPAGRAARRDVATLVRHAGEFAAADTIASLEVLTVRLLLQLSTAGEAQPEQLLQAIGLLHAARPTGPDPDHAVALLTVRLDLTRHASAHGRGGAPAAPSLDDLRAELIGAAVAHGPDRTISSLVKIATALLVELADAYGTPAEDLLARLAPYTGGHGG
jgi:hypothetical protein